MRIVVQRVKSATVLKENEVVSRIGKGLVIYLGIEIEESPDSLEWLVAQLRKQFRPDDEILLLSQFTLFGQFKNGKPSFHKAEEHSKAKEYFLRAFEMLSHEYSARVKSGIFGVYLQIFQEFDSVNAEILVS